MFTLLRKNCYVPVEGERNSLPKRTPATAGLRDMVYSKNQTERKQWVLPQNNDLFTDNTTKYSQTTGKPEGAQGRRAERTVPQNKYQRALFFPTPLNCSPQLST